MAKWRNSRRRALLVLLLGTWVALGACSSVPRYRYAPNPLDHFVPSDESVAHLLVAVAGAQEAEVPSGVELHVRLRIENLGDRPIELMVEQLELVSANLLAFGEPRVEPPPPIVVDVGGGRLVDVFFPFPDVERGELDMGGLNLRVVLNDGERHYMVGSNFERVAAPRDTSVVIGTGFHYAR